MLAGVDFSEEMLQQATTRLNNLTSTEPASATAHDMDRRTELRYGNVLEPLPWPPSTFDAVFHVNVYYFWPNCTQALVNIAKTMRPGGRIVTTLNRDALDMVVSHGVFTEEQADAHASYVEGLRAAGFIDINVSTNLTHASSQRPYQCITAIKPTQTDLK